MHVKGH